MPVRLYPRSTVEQELGKRRCVKIKDYSHGSGGLWMTPNGYYFSVPTESDGRTDENTLHSILTEIDGM
jgi:hypothetical protein